MVERKWEELNMDILVNVFGRVGMESLLLDVPFVCKPWYKASREPQCWEHLIFPEYIEPDDIWFNIWGEDSPDRGFAERLVTTYQENLSVTAFMRFIVNRSCGCATIIKLPKYCTEKALEYIANECPRLKVLDVGDFNMSIEAIIPQFISKWKSLEMMRLGKFHMKSILPQIGLHCNNFIWLSAPYTYIQKDEALVMVASLPKLKCLDLHGAKFEKEALVMILQGCKQLVHLDVRKCLGFYDDDAEILELASHIPVFMCEGSGIITTEIGTRYLHDCWLDHELYYHLSNHDDCVNEIFDFDDLFDDL